MGRGGTLNSRSISLVLSSECTSFLRVASSNARTPASSVCSPQDSDPWHVASDPSQMFRHTLRNALFACTGGRNKHGRSERVESDLEGDELILDGRGLS
jgi:hypothetical protein